jgi:putative flippase GtrA
VSLAGLIADFAVLYLLTEVFEVYYLLSAVAGFMIGLIINYLLSVKWVFNNRSLQKRHLEFIAFGAIGVVGLGINTAGMWLLTSKIGVYFLISKILVTGIVFLWNFTARRSLLFQT